MDEPFPNKTRKALLIIPIEMIMKTKARIHDAPKMGVKPLYIYLYSKEETQTDRSTALIMMIYPTTGSIRISK